jgi:hypothetical protein
MYEADTVTLMNQVTHQGTRKPDSRGSSNWEESPNAPGISWTTPLGTTRHGESDIEELLRPAGAVVYDALDRRLMDTFPASDAVARY